MTELRIEAIAEPYRPLRNPTMEDASWSYTDTRGHEHRWTKNPSSMTYSMETAHKDPDPSITDEYGEPMLNWHCNFCHDIIEEPRWKTDPNGGVQYQILGYEYFIGDNSVTEEEYKRILEEVSSGTTKA